MDGNGRRAGLVGAQQQAGGSRNLGLDPEQWIPSPKDSLEFVLFRALVSICRRR